MTAEEIMIKHCSDNGLVNIGIGKSILNAMEEYASLKVAEAMLTKEVAANMHDNIGNASVQNIRYYIDSQMPTEEEMEKIVITITDLYQNKSKAESFALGFRECFTWFRNRIKVQI